MPGFLLDTNIVSELVKPSPEASVLDWLAKQTVVDLYLPAITLGELTRGVVRLPDGRKRNVLIRWVQHDLPLQFEGRILSFDREAAIMWGNIMGEGDRRGRPYAAADAQIAATALRHGLIVATRNRRDFQGMDVELFDPWTR
jgi:toxin FitB